jgi:foldase protein PrsA
MTDEQKADAKKRADDLLARVQAGEDIGALAAEFSEDPGSKDNNGEYAFPRGQMVKPFEDWAFSAAVGDQGVVETDYGYHIMELIADSSYESVKPLVEDALKSIKAQEVFQEVPVLLASGNWVIATDILDTLEP